VLVKILEIMLELGMTILMVEQNVGIVIKVIDRPRARINGEVIFSEETRKSRSSNGNWKNCSRENQVKGK
jgi:ABC-type branched-subunit amino acid transport system ATPase component